MTWFFIFQVLTSWPENPQGIQTMGPFQDEGVCLSVQKQMVASGFNIKSSCLSIPNPAPAK